MGELRFIEEVFQPAECRAIREAVEALSGWDWRRGLTVTVPRPRQLLPFYQPAAPSNTPAEPAVFVFRAATIEHKATRQRATALLYRADDGEEVIAQLQVLPDPARPLAEREGTG